MTIKVASRYRRVLFAFIMSFNTALIVSGVITFFNAPSTKLFLDKWPSSFLLGWTVVFLSIFFVAPLVNKFVDLIVEA
jgi:Protein of unknown function (DUF2798)